MKNKFIEPDYSLSDLPFEKVHKALEININSGYKADFSSYYGANYLFDDIVKKIQLTDGYEDQCSSKYYFDLFNCVKSNLGEITRIVEVGVFMGGASSILAGCASRMDIELDLVDVNASFLKFSYERVRRSFPELAESKIRLFHGDLPSYVRYVLCDDVNSKVMLHHDGAHDFNQVVRDLGILFYVKDKLHSIAIQDTHLRGLPHFYNFVDAAIYAIFGFNVNYLPLGTMYSEYDVMMTKPNEYQGNYFVPGQVEGMYIPVSENKFSYPHPAIKIEDFFK